MVFFSSLLFIYLLSTKLLLSNGYYLNLEKLKNGNNKRDDIWKPTVGTTWNWILNADNDDIKRFNNF